MNRIFLSLKSWLRAPKLPRFSAGLVVALLLLVAVWAIAPQQLPVTLYKLTLVTIAAVAGYWLDRGLFPYARPDKVARCMGDAVIAAAMLRRAVIVAAAMLAMGLGA
ncbi:putative holin [Paucibacter sp. TC2R-5]|uniref:putative holin n=1 Tax=Paucibacter sp. TC2R-5 TaxID=2893555 RepID=UPI0021E359B5|nr:putative holin [Paucibacter sp. TC2R-5]MCV2359650.1 putative holin [Paucibacter sp. TC2R-5]